MRATIKRAMIAPHGRQARPRWLVSCHSLFVDGGAVAGEELEDLFRGFVPDEGLAVLVPGLGPGGDVGGECFDVAAGGALELLGGQRGEPALDQVYPGAVGRGEVEVEPLVTQQPGMDLGGLVGGEVV